jgi:hypothetical protein
MHGAKPYHKQRADNPSQDLAKDSIAGIAVERDV